MRTTKEKAAKVIGAPAHGSSQKNNADLKDAHFDDENYDSSSVIGSSLLQFFPSGSIDNVDERKSDGFGDGTKCKGVANREASQRNGSNLRHPCLSLLLDGGISNHSTNSRSGDDHGCIPQERNRVSRKRILLRGPPRSGKSSLAMDLAYSKASAAKNNRGENSCVAIVYRFNGRKRIDYNSKDRKNSNDNDHQPNSFSDPFPLFCRALTTETDEKYRDNIDTTKSRDQLKPTILPNTKAVPFESATKRDEEYSWDPTSLNRIKICYVSSVQQLWEDLLMLVGKPIHEQPTCVIILEDLDQIILSGENVSKSNHRNEISGKHKKQNQHIDMMLKTGKFLIETS